MPTDLISYDDQQRLIAQGDWTIDTLPSIKLQFEKLILPKQGKLNIDGNAIEKMDTAGAWLLSTWQKQLAENGIILSYEKFPAQCTQLLSLVQTLLSRESKPILKPTKSRIALFGRLVIQQFNEFKRYLAFIGELAREFQRILFSPKHFRFQSIASVVYKSGYQALPIVALLSFMIGIVITYQMGLQLKNYGANIYIVDLLGLAVLREFAPLLTAIMVAGRTGSAFTAQLGMMKINQEVDALNTMGVTPAELLLLPKIIGLFIALPLLTMWANMFGVLGGMVMANISLNITWYDFLHRFPTVIPLKTLLIGLGKAPIFALIISSIGCFQGMQVKGSADSVGQNTTRSVVLAIFFIMGADAAFSILLSAVKL
jgi:phospholipid/cholesterol/gamma-HCH transport system permease protein